LKELLSIFWAFFRIGSLMFGGGYSMLPLLQRMLVEKYKWTTNEELADFFALGQCTPGIIAIDTAVLIGNKRRKTAGAAFATAGIVMPSFMIILAVAVFFQSLIEIKLVQHAFAGIRVGAGALIVSAVVKLVRENVKSWFQILMCVASFVLVAVFGQSPGWAVLGAGIFGFLYGKLDGRR